MAMASTLAYFDIATITTVKSFMVLAPLKKLFVLTPVTKNIKFLNLISGPLVASQDVRRSGVNLKKTFFRWAPRHRA